MNAVNLNVALLTGTLLFSAPFVAPIQAAEEAPVQVPATAAAIWQAIDAHYAMLEKLIQAGTLSAVHHHAFAIRDLAAGLPAHSADLSPDQRKAVEGEVKFVASLAQRLDAAGDGNDKAGAASNLAKLKGVLNSMRARHAASASK